MSVQATSSVGLLLTLSARAMTTLDTVQIAKLVESVRLVPLDLPTIESAGGSARCMFAGLHLARRISDK